MEPLTVTAHLHTPPVLGDAALLDGVLFGALGAAVGATRDDGWADAEALPALPLARVEASDGAWWYAASQASLHGPERTHHGHRRVPALHYEQMLSERVTNFTTGPDKSLRVRIIYRPAMLAIRWTCIGDRAEIAHLLSYVGGVGARTTQGFGQVSRWRVEPGGPALDVYRTDLRVRHLPMSLPDLALVGGCMVAPKRLTPPYWRGDGRVNCLYVVTQ